MAPRRTNRRRPISHLALMTLLLVAGCAPRVAPTDTGAPAPATATGSVLRMPDGARLPLRVWRSRQGPPKAVLLGLHGFNDYSMAFDLPGSWFAAQGYTLYAYDQRGFGANPNAGIWPGTDALVRDLAVAVRQLRERHPDRPLYLLGTSMGGAVVLAAAGRERLPPVDGVVLSAPAVWAWETMPFYQRWALWLSAHTVPWMTLTGAGLDIQASDNRVALWTLGMDPLVVKATRVDAMHGLTNLMDEALTAGDALPAPALILYGEKDEIVPFAPMRRLWRQVADRPGITLGLYAQGWHLLLRDQQAYTVWRDIAAWMRSPAGGLPSDADERARATLRRQEPPDAAPAPAKRAAGAALSAKARARIR